jgi:excinuclease UvrABC nuclease subunit
MKQVSSTNAHLPSTPGLYAIGHEEELCGLEIGRTYVYVGKTNNLRRRLNEHTHLTELHPELGSYLRKHWGKVKIWYTSDVSLKELDNLERTLIRELKPEYNRIKYQKG